MRWRSELRARTIWSIDKVERVALQLEVMREIRRHLAPYHVGENADHRRNRDRRRARPSIR